MHRMVSIALGALVIASMACGSDPIVETQPPTTSTPRLKLQLFCKETKCGGLSFSLRIGEQLPLSVRVFDSNGTQIAPAELPSFVSRFTDAVTVTSGGLVTAVGSGSTYIVARIPSIELADSLHIAVAAVGSPTTR
jgi:hypothetical protein